MQDEKPGEKVPPPSESSEEIDLLAPSFGEEEVDGAPRVGGEFRIVGKIAEGGMATVYKAEQTSLGRFVALKILPAHLTLSESAVNRFRREAEAGGRQTHPGIVAVHAVGMHKGLHYIAEELVGDGRTLADELAEYRDEKPLPVGYFRLMTGFIADVADALEHSHGNAVIHRDVKPANILITEGGKPKVTDFGLAKVEDALALSRAGDFAGTPFYMSPEQAMSRRISIDHRTDIYSLGVTLYEALTLKRPFEGKTSQEVLKKIIFHEPSDPGKVNPAVPRDLAVICLKAMEKSPERRYESMGAIADDLRRFLDCEVIRARPASPVTRAMKRVRRNPVLSATAAVALLALVAVTAIGLWSWNRDTAERRKTAAINAFMTEIFSSPDPDRDGKDVTVAAFLDRAAERIDEDFPDDPEIRAELHRTIGNTYETLGIYDAAETSFRAAHEIVSARSGADHPDVVDLEGSLGTVLIERGQYIEARDLLEKVEEIRFRELGAEHVGTLAARDSLAAALFRTDETEQAEALYKTVLATRERLLGPEHGNTLLTRNNYGAMLYELRRFDEAEPHLRIAYEGRLSLLGPAHTSTLKTMTNLAALYNAQEKYVEAEAFVREVLESQDGFLPENHSDRLATWNELGCILGRLQRHEEAADIHRKVWTGRIRALGEKHPHTILSENNLASALRLVGRLEEAAAHLEHAVADALESPALGSAAKVTLIYNLADLRISMDRGSFDDALLCEGSRLAQETLPVTDRARHRLHRLYGSFLSRRDRYEEAVVEYGFLHEAYAALGLADTRAVLVKLVSFCEKAGLEEKAKEYEALLADHDD